MLYLTKEIIKDMKLDYIQKCPGICVLSIRKFPDGNIKKYKMFAKKGTAPYETIIAHNQLTTEYEKNNMFPIYVYENYEPTGIYYLMPLNDE